jgi:hypothetical protein
MTEYAFETPLVAVVRVQANSEAEARAALNRIEAWGPAMEEEDSETHVRVTEYSIGYGEPALLFVEEEEEVK